MSLTYPRIHILLGLLFAFYTFSGTSAAAPIPAPPQITGTSHLLVDFESGVVLAENNADQRLEPASITKIMTAYAVFRELKEGSVKLTDEVMVSKKAWRMGGSKMFIEVNKTVSLELLLKGMIIQSGNDASVALAEHIAGNEETFAALMNTHATRLGMTNTNFTNSTGWPHPDQYITARDIALMVAATIREFPEFYRWYAEKSMVFNEIKQHNRNKLLWRDESVDGMKTGHTEAAGFCLVASAKRKEMRLITIVMGTNSKQAREKDTQTLLNYGFRFFETHKLYSADEILKQVRIWKGSKEQLTIGLARDLFVTIPRRQYKKLDAKMNVEAQIIAPVQKGKNMGNVTVSLHNKTLAEVPLIALERVDSGGILHNMKDSALLWLELGK
ncbi:D-alanyl-D-alanine carboxypeptidase [hydrothermal vent metagenome]|uniref:serine-type D-Ala-D-Ala carboxypeptidase n=1 Tax=hydrothermal vent metagenome TaxID=652676 RepID=A0A3B1BYL1_9ZZZZ